MAGPVGHLVCALAFINSGLSEISYKNAFFAGNFFPDIRYTAPINRSDTHTKNISLMSVINEKNDFTKGHYLHIWLDKEREKFMKNYQISKFIKHKKYRSQITKLIEDRILFNQIKNINNDKIFNITYLKELKYKINYKDIFIWHELLKNYLYNSSSFNDLRYLKSIWFILNNLDFSKRDQDKSFFNNVKKYSQALVLGIYTLYKLYSLSNNEEFIMMVNKFYNIYLPEKFSVINNRTLA